jgi:type II secretory pathway pseudopilin PulG
MLLPNYKKTNFKQFTASCRQFGFTLVELLLYLGLVSIFLVLMSGIFFSTLEVETRTYNMTDITTDGQFIINRLNYDVMRATEIVLPTDPGDTATVLQLLIDGENYIFDVDNGILEVTNSNGTFALNSNDIQVTNISFTRLGNLSGRNSIDINLELTTVAEETSGPRSEIFNTTISLR